MHTGTLEHAVPSLQPLILPSLYSVAPLFSDLSLCQQSSKFWLLGLLIIKILELIYLTHQKLKQNFKTNSFNNTSILILLWKLTTSNRMRWLISFHIFPNTLALSLKVNFFLNSALYLIHYVCYMHTFGSKYKENQPEYRFVFGKGKDLTQLWKDL